MNAVIAVLNELGHLSAWPAALFRGRHACPHGCGYRTRVGNRIAVHLYIDHFKEPLP